MNFTFLVNIGANLAKNLKFILERYNPEFLYMKAIEVINNKLEVREAQLPELKDDEILIKVKARDNMKFWIHYQPALYRSSPMITHNTNDIIH